MVKCPPRITQLASDRNVIQTVKFQLLDLSHKLYGHPQTHHTSVHQHMLHCLTASLSFFFTSLLFFFIYSAPTKSSTLQFLDPSVLFMILQITSKSKAQSFKLFTKSVYLFFEVLTKQYSYKRWLMYLTLREFMEFYYKI